MDIKQNLQHIKERITTICQEKKRNPEDVKIIAVTKYVSTETAIQAVSAGVQHIGENRPEGLATKYEALPEGITWHFIGSLQTRKVKEILPFVDCIHSLDRASLAKEIQKRADRVIDCMVQVNVSGEESKHGISPQELLSFIESMKEYPSIRIVGLMTMAPFTDDQNLLHTVFASMKTLQQEVQDKQFSFAPCTELSMGMSNDYEIAVQEGATFVRIGTSLVGKEF
ncbi:alanine racemase domain-containing protein [Fictibacillus macauensis ZFHKF-1]|uniref:Pyridoxal phosphate homeostasis protein n=1 Tax=Fictibacillus macauensis ZFHKF-1 TaxID=1196324 RepID=I8UDY6_9BACL|nr:YggS family pyridoxal phosphate-dependent enzyme [Fictibacillus macauensis]EIT85008.1 alanine racemase domain-containing protein [Fictibacillus macauensis ZFHKF-1]